ncbi:MAG: helix-turn-helix domain-containing protein [Halobacteriovoraceae bacterium]|nr:helix-turn-helix domain-containing protein [Halobacteriovoraceae bacterium]
MEPNKVRPPLSIGKLLRQARMRQNVSLKAISQKTKINLSVLEYLEADDLKNLPNKTYVVGFIKSYAKVLGMDEKKCLDYFHQTYNRVFPQKLTTEAPKSKKKINIDYKKVGNNFNKINPLWLGSSVGGLLLILSLSILLSGKQEESPEDPMLPNEIIEEVSVKEPEIKKEDIKPQTLSASTPLEESKETPVKDIPVASDAPETAANTAEGQEAAGEQNREKIDQAFLQKIKSIAFRKMPETPLYKVLYDDPNGDISEYLPDSIKNSLIKGKQNIYIAATDGDTWLTYRKGKGRSYQMHLKEGNSLTIQANEIQLFMGNVNATKIFLNNLPLEIISRSGVKSLIFPQNKKSKYYLPLFVYKEDGSIVPSDIAIKQLKALPSETPGNSSDSI